MLTHINLSITIKVLPFFKPTPDTWFAHLKAQFDVKNITTSSTKFYWCIAALPSDVSAKLTHVRSETLEKIKDCLIHLYSLCNYQKFEALINLPFTSDTTPSVLMRSLLNFYPKKF